MKYIQLIFMVMILACGEVKNNFELPVLGRPEIVENTIDGETTYDTIPHTIGQFELINQDSAVINNASLEDKIYVADFFFTSCPTICPTMKQQMLRVYDKFEQNPEVIIVSHTIDPEYDTVELLYDYAERLGVSSDKWHFLTGDKDDIYDLAESSYMVVAADQPDAPGGYVHSGAFILVDKKGRVRGVYDGTVSEQVDLLMKDMDWLLSSNESK